MVRGLIPSAQILDAVRREMDDFVGRFQDPDRWNDELASFAPRTNVAETPTAYEISLDLPGMQAEDFNIELHEGRLSVTGQRVKEETEEGKTFHRIERQYGKFCRTFTLGQDVDAETVEADYSDGILNITVPKTAKAQPTRIEVKKH